MNKTGKAIKRKHRKNSRRMKTSSARHPGFKAELKKMIYTEGLVPITFMDKFNRDWEESNPCQFGGSLVKEKQESYFKIKIIMKDTETNRGLLLVSVSTGALQNYGFKSKILEEFM